MSNEEDEGKLSPGQLYHLMAELREGGTWGADGKSVIAEFTRAFDHEGVRHDLLRYVRDCFNDYLTGKFSLEAAFGLRRRGRGNPGADQEKAVRIACEMWRARLKGRTHQQALEDASAKCHCGTTKAGIAWRRYQQDGLLTLRISRALDKFPWSVAEIETIERVAGNASWLIKPKR